MSGPPKRTPELPVGPSPSIASVLTPLREPPLPFTFGDDDDDDTPPPPPPPPARASTNKQSSSSQGNTPSDPTKQSSPAQQPVDPIDKQTSSQPFNPNTQTGIIPTLNKMPTTAITAIINPVTTLKGGKTKVAIYSQLGNNTLGFEQRFLGDITNKARGDFRATTRTTTFRNPSSLFSVVLDDVVNVYGVSAADPASPDKPGNLCLLNPVYEETDTAIESGVIAGCSDGESEGWVFYQTTVKETGKETVFISEQLLTGTKSSATKLEDLSPVLPGTNLAACYDGEHRWLAYQSKEGAIVLRNIDRKKEAILEDTSYTAQINTPLGVAFVPRTHTERARIFVYFIHRDLSLRRAFLEIDDIVDFKGYGKEALVEKSERISKTSQLAIIPDSASRTNHIYAIKELKGTEGVSTQQVNAFIDNYGASIQRLEEYHHRDAHIRNRFPYQTKGLDEHHHHHLDGETVHSDHHSHFGYGFRPPKYMHHDYPNGYGLDHHLGHMSNMEFDVGKVNLNALLKLHLGEPRVEYNRPMYRY